YKEAGAKRIIPLAVSGAFHSPLMKSAGDEFVQYVSKFDFKDTNIPVYTNVDAKAETSGCEFKNKLPKQIYSPVLWTQIINNIQKSGIYNFIEIGPGKVLAGLNKKINPELNTLNVFNNESLESVLDIINSKEGCLS
ncbi:MAG: ACP S-malonyltransferase, partial [Candidatus Gastranaerophilales bacterium]|nr:ACP S-malonyltransferase [Candidatus Gastranaerophilales bacterium]